MHSKCCVYKALRSHTSPLRGSMGYEHTQFILPVQAVLLAQTSCCRCGCCSSMCAHAAPYKTHWLIHWQESPTTRSHAYKEMQVPTGGTPCWPFLSWGQAGHSVWQGACSAWPRQGRCWQGDLHLSHTWFWLLLFQSKISSPPITNFHSAFILQGNFVSKLSLKLFTKHIMVEVGNGL